jgi:hypothetical protein
MVAAPRALLLLGDLVDGHPEPAGQLEQWTSFDKLFPATGLELGGAPVPVIAGAGNHDGPVVLMQHYGFDGFSLNDWNWWTPKQRRALYELIADYNVVAILHGHNHHAEHYRWPDPKQHSADLEFLFDGKPPAKHRHYDNR